MVSKPGQVSSLFIRLPQGTQQHRRRKHDNDNRETLSFEFSEEGNMTMITAKRLGLSFVVCLLLGSVSAAPIFAATVSACPLTGSRSEERRVGKKCRSRWS